MAKKSTKASGLHKQMSAEIAKRADAAKAALTDAEAKLAGAADADKAAAEAAVADAKAMLDACQKDAAALDDNFSVADMAIANGAPAEAHVVITVIGPARGRRRAGYQFGANPVTVEVTLEELMLIEGDAELAVTPGVLPEGVGSGEAPKRLPLEAFLGKGGKPVAITVLGPAKGRRRAGRSFGASAVTFTPTKEELELVLGDAELSVAPASEATDREPAGAD